MRKIYINITILQLNENKRKILVVFAVIQNILFIGTYKLLPQLYMVLTEK